MIELREMQQNVFYYIVEIASPSLITVIVLREGFHFNEVQDSAYALVSRCRDPLPISEVVLGLVNIRLKAASFIPSRKVTKYALPYLDTITDTPPENSMRRYRLMS
jgi:hypothetical protein